MAEHSAFEKIHEDERDKADLGGVLEQLNLPPAAVEFVRKYQKIIFIVLGIIAVVVVVWSLYGSYVENRLGASTSALTAAEKLKGDAKVASLQKVIDDFSGSDSARWAKVDLAQYDIDKGEYAKGLQQYQEIRQSLDSSNPLYRLITFGIAQAQEAKGDFDLALQEYTALQNTPGYEKIGYSGTARIYEIQGKTERAINEYEQYLGVLGADQASRAEKAYVTEKLTRLKASM